MELSFGKITLVDLVLDNEKSNTLQKLNDLANTSAEEKQSISLMGGNSNSKYYEWDFKISDKLNFFENITLKLISYGRGHLPSLIQFQGLLSEKTIERLKNLGNDECETEIQNVKKLFWEYYDSLSLGLISNQKLKMYDGNGVVNFGFTMNERSEIIPDIDDPKKFGEEFRKQDFLKKYTCNIGGLISITENFGNKVSLLAQGRSLLSNHGFDFSWICKLQFFKNEHDIATELNSPFEMDNLFQLILTDLWLIHRVSGISYWKNQITKFSEELDLFQKQTTESKKKEIEVPPLFEKSHFVREFAKMLDEDKTIEIFLKQETAKQDDKFYQEFIIPGTGLVKIDSEGFLFNFYKSLSDRNKFIKEEYATINSQYEILTSHLNQVITVINTKSNVQLSESNSKTQTIMISSSVITALATIMILVLTVNLVGLNEDLVAEGQDATKILEALERNNELMLASLYSDYELELKYEIRPFVTPEKRGGLLYDMSVINYGNFDSEVTTKWYLNPQYCDENKSLKHHVDRKILISEGFEKTNVIESKKTQHYSLNMPQIHKNYTNNLPFIFEIWVESEPVSPDKKPINFFTKEAIARVEYDYDAQRDLWIPKLGWYHLDCNAVPDENNYELVLDTANRDDFHER